MKYRYLKILLGIMLFLCASDAYAQKVLIDSIRITGNRITREQIIRRELTFTEGKSYTPQGLDEKFREAYNNLVNISLFNYVDISFKSSGQDREEPYAAAEEDDEEYMDRITVTVNVEERWYIWPMIGIGFEDRSISSWVKDFDLTKLSADLGIIVDNMWGLDHTVSIYGSFGYKWAVNIKYDGITFDREGKHRLSVNGKYVYNTTDNIVASDNEPKYIKLTKEPIRTTYDLSVNYTNRPTLKMRNSININYLHEDIADTVLKVNPHYWGPYSKARNMLGIGYSFTYENRDYIYYPTDGYYFSGTLSGSFDLTSRFRYARISANAQYHVKMSNRWSYSTSILASASYKNMEAYIYEKAIGYGETQVRGYEYITVDGEHYFTVSNTLRFCIMPKKVIKIKPLSFLSKFNKIHFTLYAKVFADFGYVVSTSGSNRGTMMNTPLYSTGIGLDLVTYYDMVFGIHGAIIHTGQPGFFFTFKSSIF